MAKKKKLKIGGSNGTTWWRRCSGHDLPESEPRLPGWELKCSVDSDGLVSGRNKNDRNEMKKVYAGSFRDGALNLTVTTEDGRVGVYRGLVGDSGSTATLRFTITASPDPRYQPGDWGINVGEVRWK